MSEMLVPHPSLQKDNMTDVHVDDVLGGDAVPPGGRRPHSLPRWALATAYLVSSIHSHTTNVLLTSDSSGNSGLF